MGIELLLGPGVRFLRRLPFAAKFVLIALVSGLPVLALLWQLQLGSSAQSDLAGLELVCAIGVLALWYLLSAMYRGLTEDLNQVIRATEQIAAGDLCLSLCGGGKDELAHLQTTMGQLGRKVSAMVANVRSNAAFVAHSGKSLARGNRELSDRTEQQAANLEQTAASVEQLSSTVQDNANTAGQANCLAGKVREVADKGATIMAQAGASIEAIQVGAKRMDEIVGVIDGLAFQTNILALNAAVEAARAGESGRGFAVVASEVRSLAQRSAESSKEIRLLIGTSSCQVAVSVDKICSAGTIITQIVSGIHDVATSMSHISASSAEQSAALHEITLAVRQLDDITQRNAQMVEQGVTQAENMEGRASTLVDSVAMFKLQQGSPEEAMALVRRAAEHRHRTSKSNFLRDITDAAKGFHDRDMYVFALDAKGAYIAFGGNPTKVGTRVQDIAGIDGPGLLQSIIHQATLEPGWVEYDISNPTTGRVQAKMSFVMHIGDLYIGCGVYKNLVQA